MGRGGEQISMEMKRENQRNDGMQGRELWTSQLKKSKMKVWPGIREKAREGWRCTVHAWDMLIIDF